MRSGMGFRLMKIATIFVVLFCCFNVCVSHEEVTRVLVISFDGFRWDYLDIAHHHGQPTPNFDRLVSEGVIVGSPGIRNAFVTKTMPNHYTIVTGLFEENHGIIANTFFDPVFNETFDMAKETVHNVKWWNGTGKQHVEPIWVTNDAEGDEHHASGVYFWPGSEVNGFEPKYHAGPFNSSIPFKTRVDTVIDWLTHKSNPINLGMIYYHEPDLTGHHFGPDSKEIAMMVNELDGDVGYLIKRLEESHFYHGINLIITSDHGMQLMKDEIIYVDDYIDPSSYVQFGGSPVMNILPNEGRADEIYEKLKAVKNLLVYKKEDIDPVLHYKNNRRIMPIVISSAEGYRLCQNRTNCDMNLGNHGYDNKLSSMHPIFIAHGPAFKKAFVADPFDTVDIYGLLCMLLDIKPQPNDGSLVVIRHILASDDDMDLILYMTLLLVCVFSAIMSIVWCCGAYRSRRTMIRPRGLDATWKTPTSTSFPLRSGTRKPLLVANDDEEDEPA